jgi:hypothetical protein
MRIIPTNIHTTLDFILAPLLIISPWLFHFESVKTAEHIMVNVGIIILAQTVFSDYEAGLLKMLPMHIHLVVDVLLGFFLIASPWLYKFNNQVCLPQLIFGVSLILAGLTTKKLSKARLANSHV